MCKPRRAAVSIQSASVGGAVVRDRPPLTVRPLKIYRILAEIFCVIGAVAFLFLVLGVIEYESTVSELAATPAPIFDEFAAFAARLDDRLKTAVIASGEDAVDDASTLLADVAAVRSTVESLKQWVERSVSAPRTIITRAVASGACLLAGGGGPLAAATTAWAAARAATTLSAVIQSAARVPNVDFACLSHSTMISSATVGASAAASAALVVSGAYAYWFGAWANLCSDVTNFIGHVSLVSEDGVLKYVGSPLPDPHAVTPIYSLCREAIWLGKIGAEVDVELMMEYWLAELCAVLNDTASEVYTTEPEELLAACTMADVTDLMTRKRWDSCAAADCRLAQKDFHIVSALFDSAAETRVWVADDHCVRIRYRARKSVAECTTARNYAARIAILAAISALASTVAAVLAVLIARAMPPRDPADCGGFEIGEFAEGMGEMAGVADGGGLDSLSGARGAVVPVSVASGGATVGMVAGSVMSDVVFLCPPNMRRAATAGGGALKALPGDGGEFEAGLGGGDVGGLGGSYRPGGVGSVAGGELGMSLASMSSLGALGGALPGQSHGGGGVGSSAGGGAHGEGLGPLGSGVGSSAFGGGAGGELCAPAGAAGAAGGVGTSRASTTGTSFSHQCGQSHPAEPVGLAAAVDFGTFVAMGGVRLGEPITRNRSFSGRVAFGGGGASIGGGGASAAAAAEAAAAAVAHARALRAAAVAAGSGAAAATATADVPVVLAPTTAAPPPPGPGAAAAAAGATGAADDGADGEEQGHEYEQGHGRRSNRSRSVRFGEDVLLGPRDSDAADPADAAADGAAGAAGDGAAGGGDSAAAATDEPEASPDGGSIV